MAIVSKSVLKKYTDCVAILQKYFNLLDSYYHKQEGVIITAVNTTANTITLSDEKVVELGKNQFTDGTAVKLQALVLKNNIKILDIIESRAITKNDSGKTLNVLANINLTIAQDHGLPPQFSINVRYGVPFNGAISMSNVLTEGGIVRNDLEEFSGGTMAHIFINTSGELTIAR